ncbi:unnamed protein product, partial [Ectocarpus sp. 4 AP-2014]
TPSPFAIGQWTATAEPSPPSPPSAQGGLVAPPPREGAGLPPLRGPAAAAELSNWAEVGALLTLLALPVDFNNDRLPPPLTAATSDLELWPVATLVNDPRMPMARSPAPEPTPR